MYVALYIYIYIPIYICRYSYSYRYRHRSRYRNRCRDRHRYRYVAERLSSVLGGIRGGRLPRFYGLAWSSVVWYSEAVYFVVANYGIVL